MIWEREYQFESNFLLIQYLLHLVKRHHVHIKFRSQNLSFGTNKWKIPISELWKRERHKISTRITKKSYQPDFPKIRNGCPCKIKCHERSVLLLRIKIIPGEKIPFQREFSGSLDLGSSCLPIRVNKRYHGYTKFLMWIIKLFIVQVICTIYW